MNQMYKLKISGEGTLEVNIGQEWQTYAWTNNWMTSLYQGFLVFESNDWSRSISTHYIGSANVWFSEASWYSLGTTSDEREPMSFVAKRQRHTGPISLAMYLFHRRGSTEYHHRCWKSCPVWYSPQPIQSLLKREISLFQRIASKARLQDDPWSRRGSHEEKGMDVSSELTMT
jgi:hypothetical protein